MICCLEVIASYYTFPLYRIAKEQSDNSVIDYTASAKLRTHTPVYGRVCVVRNDEETFVIRVFSVWQVSRGGGEDVLKLSTYFVPIYLQSCVF